VNAVLPRDESVACRKSAGPCGRRGNSGTRSRTARKNNLRTRAATDCTARRPAETTR
jgi:hypothetical protein